MRIAIAVFENLKSVDEMSNERVCADLKSVQRAYVCVSWPCQNKSVTLFVHRCYIDASLSFVATCSTVCLVLTHQDLAEVLKAYPNLQAELQEQVHKVREVRVLVVSELFWMIMCEITCLQDSSKTECCTRDSFDLYRARELCRSRSCLGSEEEITGSA